MWFLDPRNLQDTRIPAGINVHGLPMYVTTCKCYSTSFNFTIKFELSSGSERLYELINS